VNALAGVSRQGTCGIALFDTNMTAAIFQHLMRRNILPAVHRRHPNRFKLILDNANTTLNWLARESIRHEFLPSYSPDLNKVWAVMASRVSERRTSNKAGIESSSAISLEPTFWEFNRFADNKVT